MNIIYNSLLEYSGKDTMWITTKEACRRLNCCYSTLKKLWIAGDIKIKRMSYKKVLVDAKSIENYLNSDAQEREVKTQMVLKRFAESSRK
jgi:excisionase family DNA binding protein